MESSTVAVVDVVALVAAAAACVWVVARGSGGGAHVCVYVRQ